MTTPGGRVIDTAYVEIRPTVASSFEKDLERGVDTPAHRVAARAGTQFGTVMGKGISLALNSKIQASIGAAGVLLQKFADDQTQAQDRLAGAIQGTGGILENYQARIDAAVDSNEKLGLSQDKTKNRLAQLTLALGSPEKALRELSVAQDAAAGTGRSFQSVVNLLRAANEGSVSAYAQLGFQVKDLTKARKELAAAESASTKATEKVSSAQQSFNDKLAVYQQSTSHTLGQQQALYRSHQALEKAQGAAAAATAKVTAAQKEARSATYDQQAAIDALGKKYRGQAAADVDGFRGKLKSLGAQAKDSAGDIISKYGNTAGSVGFALLGLSSATKVVREAFTKMRDVEVATSAEAATAVELQSARSIKALAAEGDAAVATSARMKAAFSTIGIGIAGLGLLYPDVKTGKDITGGQLSDKQFDTLQKFFQGKDPGNVSGDDLQALDKYLASAKYGKDQAANDALKKARALILGDLTSMGLGPGVNTADGSNAGDDKLAMQRNDHTIAGAKTLGKTLGKATGDSFADFLKKYDLGSPINAALAAAHDKAVAAAQKLVDDVTARLGTARDKLRSDILASKQLQLQIAQTLTQGSTLADAFAGTNSGALNDLGDRPIAGRGGVKGVEAFLHQRAVKIARFAKALTQLRKKGLDQRLVAEIAGLGTDQGLEIAEQLLSSTSADIRTINTEEQQIARAANVVGQRLANSQYGDLISADRANTTALIHKLDELKAQLARIAGQPRTVSVQARSTGATAAEIGAEAGRAVTLAMKGM